MALKLPFAPSDHHARAVHAALLRVHQRQAGGALQAHPDTLELALPHAVYDLGRDEVAAGAGLDSARRTQVRYLVMSGARVVAAAEVPEGAPPDAEPHLGTGPFAAATADAVRAVESGPLASADFELRLLRVTALHLVALWLHAEGGGADRLVPLAPAPAGLVANRAYPPDEVLAVLRTRGAEQARHRHHP